MGGRVRGSIVPFLRGSTRWTSVKRQNELRKGVATGQADRTPFDTARGGHADCTTWRDPALYVPVSLTSTPSSGQRRIAPLCTRHALIHRSLISTSESSGWAQRKTRVYTSMGGWEFNRKILHVSRKGRRKLQRTHQPDFTCQKLHPYVVRTNGAGA